MRNSNGYAVFFHPQALEALGDAVKPYLADGPTGVHLPCRSVDTSGSFVEMVLDGRDPDGRAVDIEVAVPVNMVRMIASARMDGAFGFGPRWSTAREPALPPVGPSARDAGAAPAALPGNGPDADGE